MKKNYNNSGFSTMFVMAVAIVIGISAPIIFTSITNMQKQAKLVADKDSLQGLTNEIKNILNNENQCTAAIKKSAFTYSTLIKPSGDIPIFLLDDPVSPAVKDDYLINLAAPSFPLEFTLSGGRYLSETSSQTGLPLKINSLKLYGAQKVSENATTRLYNGSVFMQASVGSHHSNPPMYVQSINMTVDIATNNVTGCYTETSTSALCLSMGGTFNPAANPACSFVGGCPEGSVAIAQADGSTMCRLIRELIGEVCPKDHYITTDSTGKGIICKDGKRKISFPDSCYLGSNGSCSVKVNYSSALSAFDKANRNIESIKVFMNSRGDYGCFYKPLSGATYDPVNSYKKAGDYGKKKFVIQVDVDFPGSNILLTSTSAGWGGGGYACVNTISAEVQLDGP